MVELGDLLQVEMDVMLAVVVLDIMAVLVVAVEIQMAVLLVEVQDIQVDHHLVELFQHQT